MNNLDEKKAVHRTSVWPTPRDTVLRLLLITAFLFPVSWAVNALLIGSWRVTVGDPESLRHWIEWMVILAGAVSVVFLVSLRPACAGIFNRRNARRLWIGLLSVTTLAVLFYTEEKWRGSRAWHGYLRELAAKGATVDFATLIPKPIPDDQNFAAAPVVQSWFAPADDAKDVRPGMQFKEPWKDDYAAAQGRVNSPKEKNRRQFMDLVAWSVAFSTPATNEVPEFGSGKLDRASRAAAVPAVLAGLKADEPVLAALREASRRPHARYPIKYNLDDPWGILLPHISNLREASKRLQLRACASLAAGRNEDALADIELIFHLADTLRHEPILVSYLVRIACVDLAAQPIWEGLADHAWTDAQLLRIEAGLRGFDFVRDLAVGLDGERAAGILTANLVRQKGLAYFMALSGTASPSSEQRKFYNWISGFVPQGWYYLEGVNYGRVYELQLEGTYDPGKQIVSPARIRANTAAMEREIVAGGLGHAVGAVVHHRLLAAIFLPALNRVAIRGAVGKTLVDEALLACALERFRIAKGELPEDLDHLAPGFLSQLPRDVITGRPYKYDRLADDRFLLYSVGWNEQDDAGTPGKKPFDEQAGDWVW